MIDQELTVEIVVEMYEDNDNYIKTFATYSIDPITNEMDVGDAVVIPKGVIIKLQKLES